jgi:subtilisin family serine protease
MEAGGARLRVKVRNSSGQAIEDAAVAFRPGTALPESAPIGLRYDAGVARYVAAVPAGNGVLGASRSGFQAQSFDVHVGPGANDEVIVLAAEGQATYFRGRARMPVDADADLLGVELSRNAPQAMANVKSAALQLGLVPMDITDLAMAQGLRLYQAPPGKGRSAVERLTDVDGVQHTGAAMRWRNKSFSFLSRDVVVRFRKASADDAAALAKKFEYEQTRELRYSPATFVWRWKWPASRKLLSSIERVAERDDVVWVEPNLIASAEAAATLGADWLSPGLWDRQLVGLTAAWRALQGAGKPRHGSPDVVLAIWDFGVKTAGGVPVNRDFDGVLSNGAPKVTSSYDFFLMTADNDNPLGGRDHGSCVASVAAALAGNPPSTGGYDFGLVGAAPNVALMTICAKTSSEVAIADQFVWMAGFDPGAPGYPPPPSRPADIINCSLVVAQGAVLTGTGRAALDWVTTFGRAGKGTLCFVATGNAHCDTDTFMPWSAYQKCFGISGSTWNGSNEGYASYSAYGRLELCAPTHDGSLIHDPPTQCLVWAASDVGKANLVCSPVTSTTLVDACNAGATQIKLDSLSGLSKGDVIHIGPIGAVGSEPARIESKPSFPWSRTLTVFGYSDKTFEIPLRHAHLAGTVVTAGPANHRNNFGGTSSASALSSGVAALVLSANPALTFVEVRQILRDTAIKFDLANADKDGQWLDSNQTPSRLSGLPPVCSRWYGHGRIDAGAAVQAALDFVPSTDLVIRDNLADLGSVPSNGDFANTPDVWCRRLPPAADPGALPANYATAGPHEDPLRGQSNWIYARVHNKGTRPSLDAWVRVSVSHFPGMEFTYPASFRPSNGPEVPLPTLTTPGTNFIGEAKVSAVPAGGEQVVVIEWKPELIPPAQVATPVGIVSWHPCLLAEITPHDGPPASGNHVWDDNNLAQKNISIVQARSGCSFEMAIVIGDGDNDADWLALEIHRRRLPSNVQLYLDLLDIPKDRSHEVPKDDKGWCVGEIGGRRVIVISPQPTVLVPVRGGHARLSTVVLGGLVRPGSQPGIYDIGLIQRQPSGRVSGAATVSVTLL